MNCLTPLRANLQNGHFSVPRKSLIYSTLWILKLESGKHFESEEKENQSPKPKTFVRDANKQNPV